MEKLIKEQTRCISHELRNHISICELYTNIIKKNLELSDIKNESIENAIRCITRSLQIMNNSLLDLKSLNNFVYSDCDLKTILEEGIRLSNVYIGDKNITISANIQKTTKIHIDENKFLACVVNIIKNAIEAIEKEGEISISTEISANQVQIKISNNGTPIPAEKQTKIFQEGFTTKKTGNGLGLFICSNSLKIQNATLQLNKSTDKITEFQISLPLNNN